MNKRIEHAEHADNGEYVENSSVSVADALRGATASAIAANGAGMARAASGVIENALVADVADAASEAPKARKV